MEKHLVNQSGSRLGVVKLPLGGSFIASPVVKLKPRSSAAGFNYFLVMKNPSICLITIHDNTAGRKQLTLVEVCTVSLGCFVPKEPRD